MKLVIVTDIEVEGDPYRDEEAATEFKDQLYEAIHKMEEVKCHKIKILNIHIDNLPDR